MAGRAETYDVLGVNISAVDPAMAEEVVAGMIERGEKGYVCVAPVATVMDCQRDEAYRRVVNGAAMVTPDGAPVAWLGVLAGKKHVRRTYGPALMERLCDHGRARGWKHFFYGASPEVCDRLEHRLKQKFPGLLVAGKMAPLFMPEASAAEQGTLALINASGADIVWVALGSPKQDIWNALNRPLLQAPVLVGIGAAFDFLSGAKPQAPRWMQAAGLEWFFRLCCEPRRLWRRYLVGNVLFLGLLLINSFANKKK